MTEYEARMLLEKLVQHDVSKIKDEVERKETLATFMEAIDVLAGK